MSNVWTVPATVLRVVGAATLVLKLDLGWHISLEARCCLVSCHAPEPGTEEGDAARAFVIGLLHRVGTWQTEGEGVGVEVTFISHELDQHGRALGQVVASTPQGETLDLGYELISNGHAVPM